MGDLGTLVEGTDPRLQAEVIEPEASGGLRPVLLLHGFASSAQLNWHDSGWIAALTAAGRRIITVDLPGHGGSNAPSDLDSYRPSRIRADLLQVLQDAGVRPLAEGDPASGLDVVGYSLGSRLAWEFGATQPELVHRMVLGGPGSGDPLAEFDLAAAREAVAGVPRWPTRGRQNCCGWPALCRRTIFRPCSAWSRPSRKSPSPPLPPFPACRFCSWPETATTLPKPLPNWRH